ncbi:GNAT family N-acetyltransferase [Butyrivibrio sp. FCS014]|uniref:GNAT family N-acetyltransferase n=1 Tax=Butyrivibrio sp. FCS014 TaxID=1408304 RepID=UPI0004B9A560|nr:GNAT family N-acetyltransferase [Butyrivibrio sp. FCS014]
MYSAILFDLDGTLTDSAPGIIHGFEYAIKQMGKEMPSKEQLRRFVGPPLEDSFGRMLGYSGEDTKRAIAIYRDYYNNMGGVLENSVYPGIEELLLKLKNSGKKLAVATSKHEKPAATVLEHFGLKKYFDVVAASNDTDRRTKADVIRYALDKLSVTDKSEVIMVGDRHHDIGAAKETGLDSIGVLWGYGDRDELENAGATYVVESKWEIMALATGDGFRLRLLKEEDDSILAAIIRDNLKKRNLDIPGTVYFDEGLDHLSSYYGKDNCRYFVLEDCGGNVVGGIGFESFVHMQDTAELQKLYLHDSVKGSGLGLTLISFIEDKMRDAGYKYSYLETHDNLEAAIHIYEKSGYLEIARPPEVGHGAMNRFYKKSCFNNYA